MLAHSLSSHPPSTTRAGLMQTPKPADGRIMDMQPRPLTAPSALTLIAHDLRGPLSGLRLLVELIETCGARRQPDKIASYVGRASAIIDGLDDMLNSVLERVLTTGDPLGFVPQTLELDRVMCGAVATTLPAAEDKGVSMLTQATRPVLVRGDRQLLHQAIENLVGNAIKHSGPGMSVRCSLRQLGGNAILAIEDTGTGLTAQDIKNAFRPFTKLSSKSSDKSRSWGLGLWIVKLIVEQHGGTISIASSGSGKGTVSSIKLPLED